MCYGIHYACMECRREALPTRWEYCIHCPIFVLSNRVDRSIEENEMLSGRVKQPKGCFYLDGVENKIMCELCLDKEMAKRERKALRKKKSRFNPKRYGCVVM